MQRIKSCMAVTMWQYSGDCLHKQRTQNSLGKGNRWSRSLCNEPLSPQRTQPLCIQSSLILFCGQTKGMQEISSSIAYLDCSTKGCWKSTHSCIKVYFHQREGTFGKQ